MNVIPLPFGEQLFPQLLDQLNDAVYMLDLDMRVVFWNRAAQHITGCLPEDLIGGHCDKVLNHCDADGKVLCNCGCPMRKAMTEGVGTEGMVYLQHRDGTRLPVAVRISPAFDANGRIVGAIQVFSDDATRVMAIRRLDELEELAHNDKLTGVRNRRFIEEQVILRLEESRRTCRPAGCIFLDIDRFKSINDEFGHDAGDEALKVVARTLRINTKRTDVAGRWGGEEFIILMTDVTAEEVQAAADRLRALIPLCRLISKGQIVPLSASFGATISNSADTPQTLVQRADHLMYQSKQLGRNRVTSDLIAAA